MQVLILMCSVSMLAMWSQNEGKLAVSCPPLSWTYLKHRLPLYHKPYFSLEQYVPRSFDHFHRGRMAEWFESWT